MTVYNMKKVLIANRGEIALRIIRACRELQLPTVAVYSDADKESLHVLQADESVYIGKSVVTESYLNQEKIFAACKATGANAIHPGFGFFSENADFARNCKKHDIIFIGPAADTIELMGDKLLARDQMIKAGVPVVPGSDGALKDLAQTKKVAEEIGFPLMLKASAGGGGKGIRLIENMKELETVYESIRREAKNYFGDDTIFLEKFIQGPHHIEVQVLGDKHNNVVHLFERECSVQRRHQKVIEEAPAPFLADKEHIRKEISEIAVKGAQQVNYDSAGTMEFIMGSDGKFYFLEMNTRIQVEHSVTEMITGFDIVKEQIKIAAGETLSVSQAELKVQGTAIECRLYAEDPESFLPMPGEVAECILPQGPFVRIDSAIQNGQKIAIEYDPMIAKISTWGRNREETVARMQRALSETMIAGSVTNLAFLRKVMTNKTYQSGTYTTNFIAEEMENLKVHEQISDVELEELLALLSEVEEQKRFTETGRNAPWMDL